MMKTVVYPGTFDPMTLGHLDILRRAAKIFDMVIVGVAANLEKKPFFTHQERYEIAHSEINSLNMANIEVKTFNGLLIDFVQEQNACAIVRGLRALSDFEFEFQMSYMNHKMASKIETVFLPATENGHFIASSFVKQVAFLGGDVTGFVSYAVATKLKEKALQ
jgi:pantetheine-phosphate adenylyltransferase